MMARFSQWQRLLGDHPIIEDIVHPVTAKKNMDPHRSRMRIKLEEGDYEALLTHIQNGKENVRDYRRFPHPRNSHVLQPFAIPRSVWNILAHLLVSVIKPNNCIKFSWEGKSRYGMIRQIYEFESPYGEWKTVMFVNPIQNLYPKKLDCPSTYFRYIIFLLQCVIGEIKHELIVFKLKRVKCVASYCLLPEDTFSIPTSGIIL